jgi:hypothetical protein
MAMSDFISFDDVRAALGVSSDEITDATLSLDLYDFNLVSELESISLNLIADYQALKETAPSTWSTANTRFHQSVRLFSAYAVAKQATTALPMFSPKEQTDGKAALVRFAQNPYKDTINAVLQSYDAFRAKLEAAYAAASLTEAPAETTRPYFVVSVPTYDPVTGS